MSEPYNDEEFEEKKATNAWWVEDIRRLIATVESLKEDNQVLERLKNEAVPVIFDLQKENAKLKKEVERRTKLTLELSGRLEK